MQLPDDPFASLIGHEAPICVLRTMTKSGRLPQALVLSGPARIGKMTVAMALAKVVLEGGDSGWHPDLTVVECEPNPKTGKMREQISVEQVQQARARFLQTPMMGSKKALIIRGAERLSTTAANALLKTLEEPRGNAHIILTATDRDALLPTITSRAQHIRLSLVPTAIIKAALTERGVNPVEADQWAEASNGCPGMAIELSESEEAREAMTERQRLAAACMDSQPAARVLAARRLIPTYDADHVKTRTELFERLQVLEGLLRDGLRSVSGASTTALSTDQCARGLHNLVALRRDLSQHLNPKLALIRCMTHV